MLTTLLEVSEDGQATIAVPVRGVIAWWIAMESLNFAEQLMTTRRDSWPTSFYVLACDFESSTDDSDRNQELPEKISMWDNDSSSDERY